MKFGVHSILFSESFVEKDLALLEKAKKLGFDTLEMPPFDYDGFPAKKVRSMAKDLGLDINIAYGMPPHYNMISPDKSVRRNAVDFTKKLVDLSNEAGAKIFGGVIYCAWGYTTGKMRSEDEWKWGADCFREVAEHAHKSSELVLGIEALNRFESHFINTAGDAVEFVKAVGLPNVKVLLDSFHMIREESNITRAVQEAGPYVGYVHANENHRGIPGSGLVPWVELFTALKSINYDGCLTIESFDPTNEELSRMGSIWRRLADSPEQLASEGLAFLKGMYKKVYG
ncbi:MAG: sugar phosphate isomerase/epimerase [Spirochaetales bacterium]|nr:sugar phosphate isomerase/epimerase [Spirochaetales bacterium]